MDPACDLPAGVLGPVFSRLEDEDLRAAELVSRTWLAVARGHPRDVVLRFGAGPSTARLESFSAWAARRSLRSLTLVSKTETDRLDLSPLAGVALKTLDLTCTRGLIDWASLQCVKSLQKVVVDPTEMLYPPGPTPDASPEYLEAYHSRRAGEVEGLNEALPHLPELVALDLLGPRPHDIGPWAAQFCHMLHWYRPSHLQGLSRLTSLALNCEGVSGLAWNRMPLLQELSVLVSLVDPEGAGVLDLTEETFGDSLTRLALNNVKLSGSFAALPPALKDLRYLGVGVRELPTLAPLKQQLTHLRLGCSYKKVETLCLEQLTALRVLWLYVKSPDDLDPVAKLQLLEELCVVPIIDLGAQLLPALANLWGDDSDVKPGPQAADWEASVLSVGSLIPTLRLLEVSLPKTYLEQRDLQQVQVGDRVLDLTVQERVLWAQGCQVVRRGRESNELDFPNAELHEVKMLGACFAEP